MKNISLIEFKKQINNQKKEINKYYKQYEKPNQKLIKDGIVNIERYYNSKLKVLWILKEAYDNSQGDFQSKGIDLAECLGYGTLDWANSSRRTWEPIVYVSYAIQNNFALYDDIDFIKDKPDMIDSLKEIAIINVQKLPACSKTNFSDIIAAYNRDKSILLKQIEIFSPDVIIGGGKEVGSLFLKDLDLTKTFKEYWQYIKGNSLLFLNEVHHPSLPGCTREEYVDEIVQTVKLWEFEIHNK